MMMMMMMIIIIIIIITCVTGTTGTIAKSFRKYLSSIPGQHDIKELQKAAILGTAHILREVLM
jgi:basic membrane lipoprotein Med (substrate-binding protein (PBP1-ABC) superfamily)